MLTDAKLRGLKPREKSYRVADGEGLMIQVEPSGSRLWRIAYRFGGKQKLLAGGKYPAVGLAAAREWRAKVKAILARGEDPTVVLRAEAAAKRTTPTFKEVAEAWLAARSTAWTERYTNIVTRRLEADAYPALGSAKIRDIAQADVIAMLRKIEARGVGETAHRLRGYCYEIFGFAKLEGWCDQNPAMDVKGAQKRKPRAVHRAKVMPKDMGAFLVKLREDEADELTHLAMGLTIRCASRTGEIRFAEFPEFENLDGPAPLWRISAERMKMNVEHLVPLSRQAVAIVKRLREMHPTSRHLFPVDRSIRGVISENRMLFAMYRMGLHSKATVHGFRGTFSTWANESLRYHPDVIEIALAHVPAGVRAAYNSALYLEPRRTLLQDWADWLDQEEVKAEILG